MAIYQNMSPQPGLCGKNPLNSSQSPRLFGGVLVMVLTKQQE